MELVLPALPGVHVSASALVAAPDDVEAWIASVIEPARRIEEYRTTTRTGWPLRIAISHTGDVWQAHAFYTFLAHVAVAAVVAGERAELDAVLPLLADGAPRWTSGIAALSELWT